MASRVGETIPNTPFVEVPYTPELASLDACGMPVSTKTHELFKGKNVVVIAIPGAWTPTCHQNHVPPVIQAADEFKSKGYEVYIIAQNDPFVQSAYGRSLNASDKVHFATDFNLEFSKALGATVDMSSKGFGVRTARYLLVAKDLKITHFAVEDSPGDLKVSGAEHALAAL